MSKSSPVLICPEVLRVTASGPTLLGNCCRRCGEVFFPAFLGCTRCGGTELDPFELGDHGVLWSWTIQGFEPKAPYNGASKADFKPFALGYVQMPSGIKIESRLVSQRRDMPRIGMPMRLLLEAYRVEADGTPVHTYAFQPAEECAS